MLTGKLILVLVAASMALHAASQPTVTATGAKLTKAATGYSFTEGPVADSQGNVFFTDQPNDRILRWGLDGKTTTWLQPCGRANGLCFDAKGALLACADENRELRRIGADKVATKVAGMVEGKRLNGPNDVWAHPGGAIYFTDPYYRRGYWQDPAREQEVEAVYVVGPGERPARRVLADLKQPNGVVGTADGRTLYVADIGAGKTYAYTIEKDGSLVGKRLFCEMGSDGMTLDNEGNVYLTGDGVTVFSSRGEKVDHIAVPERWTSNCCFGGRDRKTLFITAGGSLYTMAMRTHGVGSQ